MVEKPCVYFIRVVDTDFFYVGSTECFSLRFMIHLSQLRTGAHHNLRLTELWNGGCMFETETIPCETREEAFALEQEFITENADNFNMLNIGLSSQGGDNLTRHPEREKIIAKMTKSTIARWARVSPEEREAFRLNRSGRNNPMFGKTHTAEICVMLSEINKGNQYAKGAVRSEEVRKGMSERAKLRTGDKNPFFGRTHSDETKARIGAASKGVLPPNTNKLEVGGVLYESQAAAARALGVSIGTINFRIKSNNPKFSSYKVVNRGLPNEQS